MKVCPRCRQAKELEAFNLCSSRTDGRQIYCRLCQNGRDRELWGESPQRQKLVRDRRKKQQALLRAHVEAIKLERGCLCCPEREIVCLKFHHLEGEDKLLEICTIVRHAWSLKKLEEEIAKCVVVCGNCHDKIHAGILKLGSSSAVERLVLIQDVEGSIPSSPTTSRRSGVGQR